ncbi:MAG: CDP-alcohol phosphatidyltransferase family protein [Candidatus Angelobacter sp.]
MQRQPSINQQNPIQRTTTQIANRQSILPENSPHEATLDNSSHTQPNPQTIKPSQPDSFREARRIQQSFVANLEKRTLIWLAARTPAWINSDHLTVLGLVAMAGAGLSYWWAGSNRAGLLLAVVFLALHWLGDSLDGTLARFRDHSRPRYGFYVDHIVDAFCALFLLGGLALSGLMAPLIALGLLVAYLMLSVEIYLASYTLGDFKISYFKMGPTELRLLLSLGNLALFFWKSTVHLIGRAHRLFDVAGTIGISGMLLIMVISAIHNTMRLYRQEPIPVGKPIPKGSGAPLRCAPSSTPARENHA